MSYHKKTDKNQQEIIDLLRRVGCTVISLHAVGNGCPDILVGKNGVNYLFEVKSEGGQLNENEIMHFSTWRGQSHVIRNAEQAIDLIRSR
jgi:Holliday junction resolvase